MEDRDKQSEDPRSSSLNPRLLAFFLLLGLAFTFLLLSRIPHRNPPLHLPPTVGGDAEGAGQVLDNGEPVAGARIRIQGQPSSVLSDANGRFQIPRTGRENERLTACKEGCFIAGAALSSAPLVFNLHRLPAQDYEDYQWVDPAPDLSLPHNCGNCHGEIYQEWSASGHARSAGNRRFLNLLDGSDWAGRRHVGWSLRDDHPDGMGVCNACHAPTASFDSELPPPSATPPAPTLPQGRPREPSGAPGAARLAAPTPGGGQRGGVGGKYRGGVAASGVHCDFCHKIADASTDRLGFTHGRYGYKLLRPTRGQLFFGPLDDVDRGEDAFSPLYQESRYCAACHEGTVFGVPVYSTYSEWLTSPARREGKQCQTCHMAPTGKLTNVAPGKGGIDRDPKTLANHRFFAGSQADMLRRCLHVRATVKPGKINLEAVIEVRADQIGHRLPTGFVDRHLLLLIEAVDKDHKPVRVHEGPTLSVQAGKEWAGLAGKLYAKRLTDFAGHTPVPFWRARPEVEDNRLLPDQTDRLVFRFSPEVEHLRLRLLYRRFWPEVIQAKGWPDDGITLIDHRLAIDPRKATHWSRP